MKPGVRAKKSGKVVERYDNGELKFKGSLVNGLMHGAWTFYRRDGSRMRAGHFAHGEQTGVWSTYDRSGALVKATDFSKKASRPSAKKK
jgi:antitoxin component YwqK of YwqJK toxin-antitoxin module